MHEDGRSLVRGLLCRDPASWEHFLSRYGRVIEAACQGALVAARFAPDPDRVADAAAGIVTRLLENDGRLLRDYRGEAPLGAYLHVIARTRTLSALRRERKPPSPVPESASESPDLTAAAGTAERIAHLRRALAEMPPREADVLRRFHLEGQSHREIARELDVTEGLVGTLLFRARERLRGILGEDFMERV